MNLIDTVMAVLTAIGAGLAVTSAVLISIEARKVEW